MGSTATGTPPTPSPAPASDVRIASTAIEQALAQTDLEGAQRAQELYGDDADREIAALAAGKHPFQRELDADALAASRREAAEKAPPKRPR